MRLESINTEHRMYVLTDGKKRSVLRFASAYQKAKRLAEWCGCSPPLAANVGTEAGYNEYITIKRCAESHAKLTKQRCPTELTEQLIGLEGKRVEVVDSLGHKRRFWVAKSLGWIPQHMELYRVSAKTGPFATNTPYESVRVVRTK